MEQSPDLSQLSVDQLRTMVAQQQQVIAGQNQIIAQRDAAIQRYQIREEQLSHEIALLRRHRYGQRSEGLDKHQLSLLQGNRSFQGVLA